MRRRCPCGRSRRASAAFFCIFCIHLLNPLNPAYSLPLSLELAGLAAYQREEWAQAAYYWRHLLKRLPPDSEFYQDIEKALKDARGRAEHSSGLGERAQLEPPAKRDATP